MIGQMILQMAHWLGQYHVFPLYIQIILGLVMPSWMGFQCWYARHILEEFADEQSNAAISRD